MILPPPGEPVTKKSVPSGRLTIVGVMAESILLPGSTPLSSPWTRPKKLGVPGFAVKSSISLLSRNPAPATVTLLPNDKLSVVVTATAFPEASTMER